MVAPPPPRSAVLSARPGPWGAPAEAWAAAAAPAHRGLSHEIGVGCQLGPHVVFEGPVRIGARTVIRGDVRLGANCHIHEDVRLEGTVRLGRDCIVGDDARIYGVVTLGKGCTVENRCLMRGPLVAGSSTTFSSTWLNLTSSAAPPGANC